MPTLEYPALKTHHGIVGPALLDILLLDILWKYTRFICVLLQLGLSTLVTLAIPSAVSGPNKREDAPHPWREREVENWGAGGC